MRYQESEFLPWDGRRVPMMFIGGYLGAGKTTAINELLRSAERRIAVIVNDVGPLNIDAKLIRKRAGDMIEVTGGCVCCSSLDGMGAALDQLRARSVAPDLVVVELSGVAEPQRMLPWAHSAGFRLDATVVVVAADQLLDGSLPAWVRSHIDLYISHADLVVLTKLDLLSTTDQHSARELLQQRAPKCPVFETPTSPGALGRFLAGGARGEQGPTDMPAATLFDHHQVDTVVAPAGVTADHLRIWLATQLTQFPGVVVRAKGLVMTTDRGLVLVQVVGQRTEITDVPEPEFQQPTDLVVISIERSLS